MYLCRSCRYWEICGAVHEGKHFSLERSPHGWLNCCTAMTRTACLLVQIVTRIHACTCAIQNHYQMCVHAQILVVNYAKNSCRLGLSEHPQISTTNATPHSPGRWEVLLHFMQLGLAVKGHQSDTLLGRIFQVGNWLARMSEDDAIRAHSQIKDRLQLTLNQGFSNNNTYRLPPPTQNLQQVLYIPNFTVGHNGIVTYSHLCITGTSVITVQPCSPVDLLTTALIHRNVTDITVVR